LICGEATEMMLIMVVPDFWDVLLWDEMKFNEVLRE